MTFVHITFALGRYLIGLLVLSMGAIGLSSVSHSHALQPGYLQISLAENDLYEIVWKVPAVGGRPMAIDARLPEKCDKRRPTPLVWDGAAYFAKWTTGCVGGLEGGEIRIKGLELTTTDVLVRFTHADGVEEARRLTPSNPAFKVPGKASLIEVVRTYMMLGVDHILSGVDHLLFVLALLFLVKGARRIFWTITAFTLAHSLSLAGATLGLVHVPGPPVEAVIALSIVFVAYEILRGQRGRPSLSARYPWLVAFSFGLLHGFGFAGALAEIGLPRGAIPSALLFFNIGVEIGQLLFIAAILVLAAAARHGIARAKAAWPALTWPTWAWAIPPYAIGCIAAYWTLQRVSGF